MLQAVTYSILANTLMVMLIPIVTAKEVRSNRYAHPCIANYPFNEIEVMSRFSVSIDLTHISI